jgi:hypothetical protein
LQPYSDIRARSSLSALPEKSHISQWQRAIPAKYAAGIIFDNRSRYLEQRPMLQLNPAGKTEFHPVLGEDTWELFETIEDSFGIDLGDYHELCGETVRGLARTIAAKATHSTEERCLSAVAFYKLRRAFESLFDVPRSAIRPTESVGRLLPVKERVAKWEMLQGQLGVILPRLQFPMWIPLLAFLAPPACLASLRVIWGVPLTAIWIFNISCALWLVTFVSLIPAIDERFQLPRVLPRTCETFGGLVKVVSAHNYASLGGSFDENDVVESMRQLISMQLGVGLDQISPDTRIPNDLDIY